MLMHAPLNHTQFKRFNVNFTHSWWSSWDFTEVLCGHSEHERPQMPHTTLFPRNFRSFFFSLLLFRNESVSGFTLHLMLISSSSVNMCVCVLALFLPMLLIFKGKTTKTTTISKKKTERERKEFRSQISPLNKTFYVHICLSINKFRMAEGERERDERDTLQ